MHPTKEKEKEKERACLGFKVYAPKNNNLLVSCYGITIYFM
jgi:hypothetical protein